MLLIKRYPNRKLYDTQARRYITLDEIAELIRRGEDVQVVDHTDGANLTAQTLSQIIFERHKHSSNFLPQHLLAALIQEGNQRLSSVAHALGLDELIEGELKRRVDALVARGDLSPEEGEYWLEKLSIQAPGSAEPETYPRSLLSFPQEQIEQVLARLQIPTHSDLLSLQEQLERLYDALSQLEQGESP
jgi:polyhydroxyalkanoate synthesis repressor PhaR